MNTVCPERDRLVASEPVFSAGRVEVSFLESLKWGNKNAVWKIVENLTIIKSGEKFI